ncbi:MAG TPA: hypothetical protein VJ302_30630 [Blastocatellia bacterium]|nr:hypothetical protein [Blastocatellia bacterium]
MLANFPPMVKRLKYSLPRKIGRPSLTTVALIILAAFMPRNYEATRQIAALAASILIPVKWPPAFSKLPILPPLSPRSRRFIDRLSALPAGSGLEGT